MRHNLPKVYYFETAHIFNQQSPNMDNNTVVFIGQNVKQDGIETYAYLIRGLEKGQVSFSLRNSNFKLSQKHWDAMQNGRNKDTGQITVEGENEPYRGQDRLAEEIKSFVVSQKFPYEHAVLYFSKNVQSVRITKEGSFGIPSSTDAMHPVIQKHHQRNTEPCYNILTLLYMIQADPTVYQSVKLYQDGGIGFGKGAAHEVSVDEMIALFHKAKKVTYMSPETLFAEVDIILKNFENSKLTAEKQAIWDDFKEFYNANSNNPDMMPRSVLIENWAKNYFEKNGKNPFETLSAKRKELGKLSFLSPIIEPNQTDSIKLFHRFIAGEERSASLHALMNNITQSSQQNFNF